MIETLRDRILRHEGLRLKVYKDSIGYDTIGVGRLLSNGISQDEAMLMLDNDIERAKIQVNKELPWVLGLDEIRQNVLIEMCFQLGINRMMLFKHMISACRDGDYDKAANEMINSAWHMQTSARCEELANLMRKGA